MNVRLLIMVLWEVRHQEDPS